MHFCLVFARTVLGYPCVTVYYDSTIANTRVATGYESVITKYDIFIVLYDI